MTSQIDRTAATVADVSHEGRRLEGLAFRWEHPAQVTDDGRTTYLEEFARACCDRSLQQRPTRALGILHPWSPGARTSPIPIGSVRFATSADGLAFTAIVSRTVAGDEALELLNDEALGDVSISARVVRSRRRPSVNGPVVRREEIALRELSLAPPGMGQHPGAQVLAIRSTPIADSRPRLDEARRRALLIF